MESTPTTSMADFSCAICLEIASEPVVTRCGHLFCWSCLDLWLRRPERVPECPVCKGRVHESIVGDIIPLYGKGRVRASGDVCDKRPPPPSSQSTLSQYQQTRVHDAGSNTTLGNRSTSVNAGEAAVNARNESNGLPNSSGASEAASGRSGASERPRPAAARAPTPPRPQYQRQQVRHNMPLHMGSVFFVFGSGLGMGVVSFLILLWGISMLVPFRPLMERARNYLHHYFPSLIGRAENGSASRDSAENEHQRPRPHSFTPTTSGDPASRLRPGVHDARENTRTSAQVTNIPDAEAMMRNLCIAIFMIFFVYAVTL